MTLQQQMKKNLVTAMKSKDEDTKSALRVIMGEFGRQDKKEVPDDEVIGILKKLVKSEKEVLERTGEAASAFLDIVESYLPKMASEEEIRDWIEKNVDFSQFKNNMQAMGSIMKHFGAAADGNAVKKVLQSFSA